MIYLDIPNGNWDIELFYIGSQTDVNEQYINMIDKDACQMFINTVYQPHYDRYKKEFGKVIEGFFSDEPGFQNERGVKNDSLIGKEMPLPWSDEVKKQLEKELGNDYIIYLHYLWGRRGDEIDGHIKYIYMNIVTELYQKNFSNLIGKWCHLHGVKYIGHIIEDRDANARLGVGCGHMFRAMYGQDMAGIDVVFNQIIPGLDEGYHTYPRGVWDNEFFHYALVKLGTSLSHIDPKKNGNTMAEVFGAYGWHEGIYMMKWIVDHFLNRGVNYFVPHAFSQSNFPDEDCPPHFYAHGKNPQFRYFKILMKYCNQMSELFSNGKANPQAAILYHAEAEWCGEAMFCQKPARVLTQNQIQFDILPSDVWKKPDDYSAEFDSGLKVNGYNYDYLIIPYSQYIGNEIIEFIYHTTVKVIFIDALPQFIYNSKNKINVDKLNHVKVMTLDELEQDIRNNNISKIKLEKPEKYLRFYDYYKNNVHYYHLFNEDPIHYLDMKFEIEELNKYKYHYKIDMLNHKIELINNNLFLDKGESCVVVGTNEYIAYEKNEYKHHVELQRKCMAFAKADEYPNFHDQIKLTDFKDINRYVAPYFAGTIRYIMEFELDEDVNHLFIELQDVYELADVYIDNHLIGTRICYPYYFETKEISKGKHQLYVDVTNTLDKQVNDIFSQNEVIKPSGLLKEPIIKY